MKHVGVCYELLTATGRGRTLRCRGSSGLWTASCGGGQTGWGSVWPPVLSGARSTSGPPERRLKTGQGMLQWYIINNNNNNNDNNNNNRLFSLQRFSWYSKTLYKKEYIQTLRQKANKQHYNNRQHIKRERESVEDGFSDVVGGPEEMGFKLNF